MTLRRLVSLVFSISLLCGGIESTCFAADFRSDRLKAMSAHLQVAADFPRGDSAFTMRSGDRELAIRVAGGCVEHIGFHLFSEQLRAVAVNPSQADFVERYWLELTLPIERQKSVQQQLKEDRFTFRSGSIESIGAIQDNPSLPFTCHTEQNRVVMSWGPEADPVCSIVFPVDHELILGRNMPENDRRLPAEILATEPDNCPVQAPEGNSTYLDYNLKAERFMEYGNVDDELALVPVFDPARPQESIANLFTGTDIYEADSIGLAISHQTFGLTEQPVETTVRQFVAYALRSGCTPYVGIVAIDKDLADVLVVMNNEAAGYNHILRASLPVSCLADGAGRATARLNAFVPSSNIKNLFKN